MDIVYDAKHLKQFMQELQNIFDLIRIVDPTSTDIMEFNEVGDLVATNEKCYQIWNKTKRCQNCISFRALNSNAKFSISKLETKNDDIFRVSSKAIRYQDSQQKERKIILEILSLVQNELLTNNLDVANSNSLIYQDSLTKAFNRRFYDEKVYLYYKLDKKINHLSFIMLDMWQFKKINDSYGHLKGDEMLIAFVDTVNQFLDENNLLIRIGGDEFMIVVRNQERCEIIIQKIQHALSKIYINDDQSLNLVVNCGFANLDKENITNQDIVEAITTADEMMYHNKKTQRDNINNFNYCID